VLLWNIASSVYEEDRICVNISDLLHNALVSLAQNPVFFLEKHGYCYHCVHDPFRQSRHKSSSTLY
jgi:hypothetical protein